MGSLLEIDALAAGTENTNALRLYEYNKGPWCSENAWTLIGECRNVIRFIQLLPEFEKSARDGRKGAFG